MHWCFNGTVAFPSLVSDGFGLYSLVTACITTPRLALGPAHHSVHRGGKEVGD
jgi:hypothetical protein